MRHSNTGKSDPQPAAERRGFFAAAGERLKRAMSGPRAEAETAAAAAPSLPQATPVAEPGDSEVTTSVQAKARELLQQDRENKRARARTPVVPESVDADATDGESRPTRRNRKTSPPPLPRQRTAADAKLSEQPTPNAEPAALTTPPAASLPAAEPAIVSAPRAASARPVRDSKSDALRARLSAAKAARAQAQAQRATIEATLQVEPVVQAQEPKAIAPRTAPLSEITQPEVAVAEWRGTAEATLGPQPSADSADVEFPEPTATSDGKRLTSQAEPIRTLTIARVLARQGYYDRSISIYDALLAENSADAELRAEADRVRAQKTNQS